MTKLQSLQAIIELNEFLKFIDANPKHLTDSQTGRKQQSIFFDKVDGLSKLWLQTMPNTYSDPAQTWDDVITNRCLYFDYIQDNYLKTKPFNIVDDEEDEADCERGRTFLVEKIDKTKLIMKLNFANAAQLQTNYKLALNKLQQTKFILKSQSSKFDDLKLNWIHCYTRTHLANCKSINSHERSLRTFLEVSTISKLVEYEACANSLFTSNNSLYCDQQILNSNICKLLIDSFVNINGVDNYLKSLDRKLLGQLISFANLDISIDVGDFCSKYEMVFFLFYL
jgi:hypothetical protein